MTVELSGPSPFYCPGVGWRYDGRVISAKRAEDLCVRLGIPYHVPDPSDPDIYVRVLDTRVAGSCFAEGSYEVISKMSEGDDLRMVREDNVHDRFAVALYSGKVKIGYIPRSDNQVVARLMDAGDAFQCVASDVSDVDDVQVTVFMRRPGKKVRRHFDSSEDSMCGTIVWIDAEPVTRFNSGFTPMSDCVSRFDFEYDLTEDDLWNLSWGHRSASMDDRWNFFMEGRTMYISRSWTGLCLLEVVLCDDGVHRVTAETDKERCKMSPEEYRMTLRDLLDRWTRPVAVTEGAVPVDVFGNVTIYEGYGDFKVNDDGAVSLHNVWPVYLNT